jgi:hypothetical protein
MVFLLHDVLGMVEFGAADEPDRWESEIPWLDDTIGVSITLDEEAVDQPAVDRVGRYITDLAEFDRTARAAMRTNGDDENAAVRLYLDHHADEPDLIRPVLGLDAGAAVAPDAFVNALRLVRVGLHASTETSEPEAVFDYSIDPDRTQYLVVVRFNVHGHVDDICIES